MTGTIHASRAIWALVRRQHGVVSRRQLLELGLTRHGIQERLDRGRLHRIYKGVYSVGRPELTGLGRWTAAVLACGPEAVLSGRSAAQLWGIFAPRFSAIEVTIPARKTRSCPGVRVKSRRLPDTDITTYRNIPLTTPVRTLIDLAATLRTADLERAVNEADQLDLVDPETLRTSLDEYAGVPGARMLRTLLDHRTFILTDSVLEQRFLPIARSAGLPRPLTQFVVNGHRVDFFWPDLGLVVETDGLRYHRTPAQQARDRDRDQAHTAAGLTTLRFTHSQIRYVPRQAERVLRRVGARLASQPPGAA